MLPAPLAQPLCPGQRSGGGTSSRSTDTVHAVFGNSCSSETDGRRAHTQCSSPDFLVIKPAQPEQRAVVVCAPPAALQLRGSGRRRGAGLATVFVLQNVLFQRMVREWLPPEREGRGHYLRYLRSAAVVVLLQAGHVQGCAIALIGVRGDPSVRVQLLHSQPHCRLWKGSSLHFPLM